MLQIRDLVFDAWGRRFFDGASVRIDRGAKVGLVGRNGAGKSTLFRLILGELSPGSGEIRLVRGARVAAVAQEHPATPDLLLDTVLAADAERARLLRDLDSAEPEALGEIYARLGAIEADRAPARASEILAGLGFSDADLTRPLAEFSGGWRMRVALAAALFAEPDLLLLDEPTNYLDLEGALWLEARLARYPAAALVISHDRELLNNAVSTIVHLHDGRLDTYAGGYDAFERQRVERARAEASAQARVDAQRAHMQAFVDRFRYKESKARQAQSRLKMLARLPPPSAALEDNPPSFRIPSPERPLSPPILTLEAVSVGYAADAPVLRRLSLRLDGEDRIGLLGVNGAGKSTFAKLLAGALAASAGRLTRDRRLKVGWFHQHQIEALDPDETPLDIIRRRLPEESEAKRRARLGQFGFPGDRAETPARSLSGGERARLLLNLVVMDAPHLIILDEPTNHLDIEARRALLDGLNAYEGAVLLITHDRSLMEMVADRLWLAADGTVAPFDGDMADYAALVLERARRAARVEKSERATPSPVQRRAKEPPRVAAEPLRRRLEAAEAALARETRAVAEIDAALADPALYVRDPKGAAALAARRADLQARLDAAEARWLEAAEALESVRAS